MFTGTSYPAREMYSMQFVCKIEVHPAAFSRFRVKSGSSRTFVSVRWDDWGREDPVRRNRFGGNLLEPWGVCELHEEIAILNE